MCTLRSESAPWHFTVMLDAFEGRLGSCVSGLGFAGCARTEPPEELEPRGVVQHRASSTSIFGRKSERPSPESHRISPSAEPPPRTLASGPGSPSEADHSGFWSRAAIGGVGHPVSYRRTVHRSLWRASDPTRQRLNHGSRLFTARRWDDPIPKLCEWHTEGLEPWQTVAQDKSNWAELKKLFLCTKTRDVLGAKNRPEVAVCDWRHTRWRLIQTTSVLFGCTVDLAASTSAHLMRLCMRPGSPTPAVWGVTTSCIWQRRRPTCANHVIIGRVYGKRTATPTTKEGGAILPQPVFLQLVDAVLESKVGAFYGAHFPTEPRIHIGAVRGTQVMNIATASPCSWKRAAKDARAEPWHSSTLRPATTGCRP